MSRLKVVLLLELVMLLVNGGFWVLDIIQGKEFPAKMIPITMGLGLLACLIAFILQLLAEKLLKEDAK